MTPRQLASHAENLDLINQEVTASLARQAESGDRVDSKAVLVVGYAGAASAFLATQHDLQPVLAALAFAAFGASVIAGVLAYAVQLRHDVPEPRRLLNYYLPMPRTQTLAALAATRVTAFEGNARKNASKGRRWWISVACTGAGMVLMVAAITAT